MEYRFEIDDRAIADANFYFDRIAEHSPGRAERWYRGLFARIDTLKKFPLRCPRAPESEKFGEEVRELLYGKRSATYRVLFVIRGDVIKILAIWRGTRGPTEL